MPPAWLRLRTTRRSITGHRRLSIAPTSNGDGSRSQSGVDLFPEEPSVHFALASLYEAEGNEEGAIEQFAAYVDRSTDVDFIGLANARLTALTAPPAPIITTVLSFGLKLISCKERR